MEKIVKINNNTSKVVKARNPKQLAKRGKPKRRPRARVRGTTRVIANPARALRSVTNNFGAMQLKDYTSYKNSLLYFDYVLDSKIPGSANPVVAIRARRIFQFQLNALGNGCGQVCFDNQIFDNTAGTAYPVWFFNTVGYNGTAPIAAAPGTAQANPFNLSAGLAKSYRTVSGGIYVRSLAANLNLQGDIHIALANGAQGNASGNNSADMVSTSIITNLTSITAGKYALAHVERGEAARCAWIPNDISCMQFKTVNTNYGGVQDNWIAFICLGLQASSFIEVEIFINYEVTPLVGGTLYGMDKICMETVEPNKVWRDILLNHNLATSVKSNNCYDIRQAAMGLRPQALIQ